MRGMKLKMSRETKKLFRVRRKFSPISLVVPMLLVLLMVCAVVYDNSRIVVDEVRFSMPTLPKNMEGTAILHISDIRDTQFGEEGESLARALEDYDYDLVVMTGDVLGTDGDTTGFYQSLDYFAAQGKPVYFITGDNDPPATCTRQDGSFGPAQWVEMAQSKGAVYLDVPVAVSEGDTRLWLMPASALVLDTASPIASLDGRLADETLDDETVQSILYRKARYQAFADEMEKRQHNDLTVMLSHIPCLDPSLQSESSTAIFGEADLILSGHHLGGQICLPFIGAIKAENEQLPRDGWFPESRYLTGLHEVNATYQCVSTGLGTTYGGMLNFRLWNPPKVSIITLTRKVQA